MAFNTGLNPGDIVNNNQLQKIFQCSGQGGMRRSHKTNTLIIVSNHIKSIYDDRWDDKGIMHYTGMGSEGDQSLMFSQNKTLTESKTNDIEVFLFEVFKQTEYTYMGAVELTGDPYQSSQTDLNDNLRNVWIFPLKLTDETKPIALPKKSIDDSEQLKITKVRKLSDQELENQAKQFRGTAGVVNVQSKQYTRNPYISEHAKRRAKGICQLCLQAAPFKNKSGDPFLETHHIQWLSKGGEDSIKNTVALCPNCHRKMHLLNLDIDRLRLGKRVDYKLSGDS